MLTRTAAIVVRNCSAGIANCRWCVFSKSNMVLIYVLPKGVEKINMTSVTVGFVVAVAFVVFVASFETRPVVARQMRKRYGR